jgi:hypothetical protein
VGADRPLCPLSPHRLSLHSLLRYEQSAILGSGSIVSIKRGSFVGPALGGPSSPEQMREGSDRVKLFATLILQIFHQCEVMSHDIPANDDKATHSSLQITIPLTKEEASDTLEGYPNLIQRNLKMKQKWSNLCDPSTRVTKICIRSNQRRSLSR